jgi:hypothetical protein
MKATIRLNGVVADTTERSPLDCGFLVDGCSNITVHRCRDNYHLIVGFVDIRYKAKWRRRRGE